MQITTTIKWPNQSYLTYIRGEKNITDIELYKQESQFIKNTRNYMSQLNTRKQEKKRYELGFKTFSQINRSSINLAIDSFNKWVRRVEKFITQTRLCSNQAHKLWVKFRLGHNCSP